MSVPMLNKYCRRCHAAIISTAHTCPLCGLSRPNADTLSEKEKKFINSSPSIPHRFETLTSSVSATESLFSQIFKLYFTYLKSREDSLIHRVSLFLTLASIILFIISNLTSSIVFGHFGIMILSVALCYLLYDGYFFFDSVSSVYLKNRLFLQGGTSPYSVHFKVETVLQNTLKSLQSLLYAFYEKPWEKLAQETDILKEGNSFILATQALESKLKKFSSVSLETMTLLWRNNVYAITSLSNISYEDKINHLKLKIMEAKAIIIRYCWLRQLESAHEFLENHLKGNSGRTTSEDSKYVIEGMQLGLLGPLTERYVGNFETVPYDLPFIMRYYWHQQIPPNSFPEDEIKEKYPETAELFESISQVNNLISKLEEQKIISIAENAVNNDFKEESAITSEANQIKRFKLYSDYLDIPKFQPDDKELLEQVDRLNAQIKVQE